MGSKHLTDEQIALFAEAMSTDSSEKLSLEWRTHVSNCDECSQMVLMVSETISDEKNADNIISIDKKPIHKSNRWILIAATVAILLSAGFLLKNLSNQNSFEKKMVIADTIMEKPVVVNKKPVEVIVKEKELEHKKPVAKKKIKKPVQIKPQSNTEMLAYAPNEQLEKLANRFSASSAMRGDDVKVLSPNSIEGKAQDVNLEWENSAQQLLIVEFFNNNGDLIFEVETSDSKYTLDKLDKKGLYYWKLINEDFDLLFCGKVKIK